MAIKTTEELKSELEENDYWPTDEEQKSLNIGQHLVFLKGDNRALAGAPPVSKKLGKKQRDKAKDLLVHSFVDAMLWWQYHRVEGKPLRFEYYVRQEDAPVVRDAVSLLVSAQSEPVEVFENGQIIHQCCPDFSKAGEVRTWSQRLRSRPALPAVAAKLKEQAADGSFCWYRNVTGDFFSGRLEGLQVCRLQDDGSVALEIGRGEEDDDSDEPEVEDGMKERRRTPRSEFRGIAGQASVPIADTEQDIERAKAILSKLSQSRRCGALAEVYREHHLESRVLRGDLVAFASQGRLSAVRGDDDLPFQFPALWALDGRPRYVDALLRYQRTPWVVELKVPGNEGQYYRNGITQAVLYREFIRRASEFDEWFTARGLDRMACKAALAFPYLQNKGKKRANIMERLGKVAKVFDVELIELPAWYPKPQPKSKESGKERT